MPDYKVVLVKTNPESSHSCTDCIFLHDKYDWSGGRDGCNEPDELGCQLSGVWKLEETG